MTAWREIDHWIQLVAVSQPRTGEPTKIAAGNAAVTIEVLLFAVVGGSARLSVAAEPATGE